MAQSSGEPVSVLVVEDESGLATLYETYLEPEFDVRTATSGEEALERFDGTVDVVLLDRQMPEMSGDEVLAELRDRGYDVPVAMVTAVEPDADIVDMAFDEYLGKPIEADVLVRTVRVLANRSSFEAKSREFFRLAAKKASLDAEGETAGAETDGDADPAGADELVARMADLRQELDGAIADLLADVPTVVPRSRPDEAETETLLTEVYEHTLPADLRELIEDYQKLEDARPPFMWKWVHRLAPQNTLPSVHEEYREDVPIDKTIAILFTTLLDDVLEKHRDRATFDEIAKVPSSHSSAVHDRDGVNTEYVRFSARVWETLVDRIRRAPNFEAYRELFEYDVKQAVQGIEYSRIAIFRPELATMGDLERYESHNMMMFTYADIDLMHSPIEVREDLPTLREAIWTAQLMARIGNWVSTWERELREGDFSSGPVVYALDSDIISRGELAEAPDDSETADRLIDRIKSAGVEKRFLTEWEQHYHRLEEHNTDLSQLDLGPFIEGTEEVLRYHLASTGLK